MLVVYLLLLEVDKEIPPPRLPLFSRPRCLLPSSISRQTSFWPGARRKKLLERAQTLPKITNEISSGPHPHPCVCVCVHSRNWVGRDRPPRPQRMLPIYLGGQVLGRAETSDIQWRGSTVLSRLELGNWATSCKASSEMKVASRLPGFLGQLIIFAKLLFFLVY